MTRRPGVHPKEPFAKRSFRNKSSAINAHIAQAAVSHGAVNVIPVNASAFRGLAD
jgi:hypothetical protein